MELRELDRGSSSVRTQLPPSLIQRKAHMVIQFIALGLRVLYVIATQHGILERPISICLAPTFVLTTCMLPFFLPFNKRTRSHAYAYVSTFPIITCPRPTKKARPNVPTAMTRANQNSSQPAGGRGHKQQSEHIFPTYVEQTKLQNYRESKFFFSLVRLLRKE